MLVTHIKVYRLIPCEQAQAATLTLVGRQAEFQRLQELWQQAANSGAKLVLVTGQAGIGESRLVEELFHRARRCGATAAQTRCYAAEGRLSLAPVTDLLRRAGNDDGVSVIDALDELWQKHIVRELSANQFDFTHDKLREVAYAQIGRPQRRQLHRRIAAALETLNAQNLDAASTQIAAHYEQAGLIARALPYYQRAAWAAADVYANDSAIDLFKHALALLAELLVGTARDTQKLILQLALSPLYRITKGSASREVEHGLNRALELSSQVGDTAQRAQTLYGLQSFYVVAARLSRVEEIYSVRGGTACLRKSSTPTKPRHRWPVIVKA